VTKQKHFCEAAGYLSNNFPNYDYQQNKYIKDHAELDWRHSLNGDRNVHAKI